MSTPIDLGLTDEDYWVDPAKNRIDIENALLDDDRECLVLGAPARVEIDKRKTLPAFVLRTATLQNMADLSYEFSAVITAIETETHKVSAYRALVRDREEPEPSAGDGAPLKGMGAEAHVIDVREQLGLRWGTGTYLLTLILRDQVSERVRTNLVIGGFQDPAVAERIRLERAKKLPPLARPREASWDPVADAQVEPPLPSYRQRAASPPVPSDPGIALSLERTLIMADDLACVVHGSFRLPISPDYLTKEPEEGDALVVVPITLLLTGSKIAAPILMELAVPSRSPLEGTPEAPVATGFFAFDMSKRASLFNHEQTYFVYAFSGDVMAGPVPMALISSEQVS